MTNSTEIAYFLGIQVRWNQRLKKIHLSLEKYLNDILAYFMMDSCHLVTTPFLVVLKLNKSMAPIIVEDIIATKDIPYKNVVGSLMLVMVCTFLDMVDLVFHIFQFMNNPRKGALDYYKKAFMVIRVMCLPWNYLFTFIIQQCLLLVGVIFIGLLMSIIAGP
jgi:hypothetical protein